MSDSEWVKMSKWVNEKMSKWTTHRKWAKWVNICEMSKWAEMSEIIIINYSANIYMWDINILYLYQSKFSFSVLVEYISIIEGSKKNNNNF